MHSREICFASLVLTFLVTLPSIAEAKSRQWNSSVLKHDDAWYRSDEAQAIANAVMRHQASDGGWPKNVNLTIPPSEKEASKDGKAKQSTSTFDNDGTTLPLQFLARMASASSEVDYRRSFYRGLDYTLAAQYPNGGWPQYFPLRKGYYSNITFNDNAMIRVMTLLRDVSSGEGAFSFVDDAHKEAASLAVQKGVECILRTQVKQNGKPTAWCAQYNPMTLQPTWARAYEPPSLSGAESVGIVRFLMELEEPTPEIKASIEGAIEWLQAVAIKGVRFEEFKNADGKKDRRIVKDPSADPLWARFYELKTNRPIFLDRDSIVRYDIAEIDYERRSGYSYYGDWAANVLAKNYPRWSHRQR
jgi:PelA/Pel-15E family pectate lyase